MAKNKATPPGSANEALKLDAELADFQPDTGLDTAAYARIADSLGKVLADSYQLFIKTQGVHWNVAGASFYGLHKLTEGQYGDIYLAIDKIAERIRAVGHHTPASLATYVDLASIKDEDRPQDAGAMVAMLVRDNGILCRTLRNAVEVAEETNDVVTADLLTNRLAQHEQNGWMLRMHLG